MNDRSLKLYILGCSNSFDLYDLGNDLAGGDGYALRFINVPCSGKVDLLYLLKLFETGADGVMLLTCKEGECRYLEGNLRARRRADAVATLLEEIGLGGGRMAIIQSGEAGSERIVDRIRDFSGAIKKMPSLGKRSASVITDATAEHSASGHGGLE